MKSLSTLVLVAYTAALTTAQVTSNPDGTFTCAIPNAAYCAGDSLTTNIIIRCVGTVGQPGNCNDNLDGEFPFGLSDSPCWQPSATSGQAACSKNCVVYGGSGNFNGTFTLPDCTPSATPSSSTSFASATSSVYSASSSSVPPVISYTTIVNSYTTVTVPCVSTPSGTGASTLIPSTSGNSTVITPTLSYPAGSPTATPVGPTTTKGATFTGAANANHAGGVLAAAGLFMAYLV